MATPSDPTRKSFLLSDEDHATLVAAAKERGVRNGDIVTEILRRYLDGDPAISRHLPHRPPKAIRNIDAKVYEATQKAIGEGEAITPIIRAGLALIRAEGAGAE